MTVSPERAEGAPAAEGAWRHVANEWADMATSGIQWLRNIRDGVSTVEDALENMQECLKHCNEVRDVAALSPPAAEGDLHDVVTHREAWRSALEIALEHAEVSPPDIDDVAHWRHEIRVFDRTFARLAALSPPAAEPVAYRQDNGGAWCYFSDAGTAAQLLRNGFNVQPLYTSPPPEPVAISREELVTLLGSHIHRRRYLRSVRTGEVGYSVVGFEAAADAILAKMKPNQ